MSFHDVCLTRLGRGRIIEFEPWPRPASEGEPPPVGD